MYGCLNYRSLNESTYNNYTLNFVQNKHSKRANNHYHRHHHIKLWQTNETKKNLLHPIASNQKLKTSLMFGYVIPYEVK